MMRKLTKKLTIVAENITLPQWNSFVIEANLMTTGWKRFGPKFKLQTPDCQRIIARGKFKPGDRINEDD
tara:strand:+ start:538 stop:744 length:207 start_codon:yes stop_codon:yes gene_type:complete